MKFKAEPWERFLVLSMMFGETDDEREPTFGKVKNPGPARRKEMLLAGILRSEKRGRTQHLLLDDGAWDFVVENLGQPLPPTQKAGKLLERVLGRLGGFLETHGSAFSDFVGEFSPRPTMEEPESPAVKSKTKSKQAKAVRPKQVRTEQELRAVCLSLGGGQVGKPIRLADLRANVTASRELIDQLLQSMQQAGSLVLFKLDNPAEITPDDEQAALDIAGHPRHLVYLEA